MIKDIKYVTGTDGEIADKMMKGEIVGPVITNNCILINIRITGTGETPRTFQGRKRIFNRPAGVFLSDKFLNMCNGLPCVYCHPKDGELDYDNWGKNIIGTVMLPYINDKEVWGIAKVFDLSLLKEIIEGKIKSTSPFVMSRNEEVGDGIVEEKLEDLNHVAFCKDGHWDQNATDPAIKIGDIVFKKNPIETEVEKKDFKKTLDNILKMGVHFEKRGKTTMSTLKKDEIEKSGIDSINIKNIENGYTISVNYKPTGTPPDQEYPPMKEIACETQEACVRIVAELTGGENKMDKKEMEQMKADSLKKDEEITSLKNDIAKRDEADAETKKKEDEAAEEKKKKDEEEAAEEKKKKDAEEAAAKEKKDAYDAKTDEEKAKEKKDAEEAEEKKKKDAEEAATKKKDFKEKLTPLKAKFDTMLSGLKPDADEGVKNALTDLSKEVEALIAHEAAEGELHEELIGDDEDEKEELVNSVSELADSAHADIAIHRPAPKCETKYDYIRRVLLVNKELVDPKFHGLISKVDSSNFELAKNALTDMTASVKAKGLALMGAAGKGAKVAVKTSDGAVTHVNYGRN